MTFFLLVQLINNKTVRLKIALKSGRSDIRSQILNYNIATGETGARLLEVSCKDEK